MSFARSAADSSMDRFEPVELRRAPSAMVGDTGPYRECRWRSGGLAADGAKCSSVTGRGCIDLRREATLAFGFMWKDLRDMALRRGSDSTTGKLVSCKGECGAGDESLEVERVPGPDREVEFDM